MTIGPELIQTEGVEYDMNRYLNNILLGMLLTSSAVAEVHGNRTHRA